jgi:hypothetical protein
LFCFFLFCFFFYFPSHYFLHVSCIVVISFYFCSVASDVRTTNRLPLTAILAKGTTATNNHCFVAPSGRYHLSKLNPYL